MRFGTNAILIVIGVVLVFSSVVIGLYYISSFELQSGSDVKVGVSQATKPAVVLNSRLTSGSVRPPSALSQRAQAIIKASEPVSSSGWLWATLVTLSIATLISTAISFYLYRWRRILLRDQNVEIVVPEQFGGWINGVGAKIERLTNILGNGVENVTRQSHKTNENVSNLIETFMTLQQALDERDQEIVRLKRGYDAEIFRKFISRFIRVDQVVEDLQRTKGLDANGLEHIRRLLEDALSECGVESFQPDIGADYRKADGVADNPKSVQADNPEDAYKIIEVLENGYQLRSAEGRDILIPAKVKIFIN